MKPESLERAISHWIGLVILLYVLVAPINSALGVHLFLKESIIQVFVFLSVAGFLVLNREFHPRVPKHWLIAVGGILLTWAAASVAWSENRGYAIEQLLRWVTAGAVFLAVFQIRGERSAIVVLRYIVSAGLIITSLGIVQYLFDVSLVPQARGPAATFANRNMAMHIVILTWMSGGILMVLDRRGIRSYVYALSVALAVTFATYTQTRAAWLAMFVQVALIVVFFGACRLRHIQIPRLPTRAALAGTFVCLVLVNFGPDGFDPLFGRVSDRAASIIEVAESSGSGAPFERFIIWRSSLEMVADHPLTGVGLGNFSAVHPRYAVGNTVEIAQVHNDYLQIAVELGLPGLAALMVVVLWLCWTGVRLFFFMRKPDLVQIALIVSLAGVAVAALFSFPMQLMGGLLFSAVIFGLMFGQSELSADEVNRQSRITSRSLAFVAVPIAILFVALNINWWMAVIELERKARDRDWAESAKLNVWLDNAILMRLLQRLGFHYQTENPAWAEAIMRSHYGKDRTNVVINNILALALIQQGKFVEATDIIVQTRRFEPPGYLRSYENEQILAAKLGDTKRLAQIVDELEAMPIEHLSAQPGTLTNLAKTAYNLGQPARAIELLQENLKWHRQDFETHRTLVRVLQMTGRHGELSEYWSTVSDDGLSEAQIDKLRSL